MFMYLQVAFMRGELKIQILSSFSRCVTLHLCLFEHFFLNIYAQWNIGHFREEKYFGEILNPKKL